MKYLIFLIILFFSFCLKAQNLIVQGTFINVLYVGIENELVIRYKGVKDEDLLVMGDINCVLIHKKEATYIAKPENKISCKIYVGLKKNEGKKWLDSIEMQIRLIPVGKVMFGNLEGDNQTVAELLKQDSLYYKVDTYVKNLHYGITKYTFLIVPSKGVLIEYSQNGSKISKEIKQAIAGCSEGDIILIDRIRASGPYGERPLSPIMFTIHNYRDGFQLGPTRVVGYYRDSGILKEYRYPIEKDQPLSAYRLYKDSIWTQWDYNHSGKKYLKSIVDSFSNNVLIHSVYFNDSTQKKDYLLKRLSDSTYAYTSYYSNGNAYQNGIVRINTLHKKFRKYLFYEDKKFPTKKEAWETCLKATPEDLFPIGPWQVYDSLHNLQMEVNYGLMEDSSVVCGTDPEEPTFELPQRYYIIVQGTCILYKNGKVSETIIFKDGKPISR